MNIIVKIFIFVAVLWLVGCTSHEINPYKQEVSVKKQWLQQANIYWGRKEYDILNAYVYRQRLPMMQHLNGYYSHVIVRGNGVPVRDGSKVALSAQIYLLDGTLCYDYDAEHPLMFIAGKSDVMSGLHVATVGMREGTEALLLFSSRLGYGLMGDRNKIPPQSPLLLRIKILSVE
jgi:FKBP-type peptidyl-prolyl cis-trans isomerase